MPAAIGNAFEQHFVRSRLGSDDALAGCGVDGDDVLHDRLPLIAVGGVSLAKLIVSERFGTSAREAENGFVPQENCFVAAAATKHSGKKDERFQWLPDRPAAGR